MLVRVIVAPFRLLRYNLGEPEMDCAAAGSGATASNAAVVSKGPSHRAAGSVAPRGAPAGAWIPPLSPVGEGYGEREDGLSV